MIRFQRKNISGWGHYPSQTCYLFRPEKMEEISKIIASDQKPHYIPHGLGRSYGDTALNMDSGVILTTKCNRFISFNEDKKILTCEAGVTLAEIIDLLLPRGFFLPVTPGTKFITIGGALANDIHGKNHHQDGSFSEHILDFSLLTASGKVLQCSRQDNEDLFWATIGGLGLTGVILHVRLRLISVESAYMEVDYHKASHIDEALEHFEATDRNYQYSVAWIDCLASGRSLGRSVLMRGNHAPTYKLPTAVKDPLRTKHKNKLNIPIHAPSFSLNRYSVSLFNAFYYGRYKDNSQKLVDYDSFFYPLDSVLHWNRLYGKKGFVQYQVVFPPETSRAGLITLLERISRSKKSSFLAVLKSFGEGSQGLLSFPCKGYTLALDMPIQDDSLFPFLRELDEEVVKHGGRVYVAKDSRLAADLYQQMYPSLPLFKEVKRKIDPQGLFSSSMARRLGIMGGRA